MFSETMVADTIDFGRNALGRTRKLSRVPGAFTRSPTPPPTMQPRSGKPGLHPAMRSHTPQADRAAPVHPPRAGHGREVAAQDR